MRFSLLAASAAALFVTNAATYAATNNAAANNQPQPIEVITVSATPVTIDEAGSSVSVITREDILRRNAANLTTLLREIPGFALSQQGAEGSISQLRVRGAEANQVLVLINGIEANDISQGSEFDFSQVAVSDIERIEIVRGPQSALWGSDATAGVIHIITESSTAESSVEAAMETGSFGTTRANLTASYGADRGRVKFTADFLDSDGTNISRRGSEKDGFDNLTLGLTGSVSLTDDLSLRYTARRTEKTTEFDGTDFLSTGLPADADNETESVFLYTGVSLDHTINSWLDHRLSFSRTDADNETVEGGFDAGATRGVKNAARYQVNLQRGASHLSLLLEHEKEDFRQRGPASPYGDPNQNRESETDSIAFEYRFDAENFDLSLSARRDNNSEFEDASAWRVTGNYQLPAATVYASIGEGIKNPTFSERFGYFTNFIGNPNLSPERSLSWEIGVRGRYLDDRLGFSATWFEADLTDEINSFVFDPVTFGFTAKNMDGDSERRGVELTTNYELSATFDVRATWTWLDATQGDTTGGNIIEVRRPEHSGSIALNYQGERSGATLSVSYTGEQEDDYFPPFPPWQTRVDLPGFTLVNLSGYYDVSSNVTLTARLENVTDRNYEQVYGFESPGFGGYVGVRLRW